MDNIIIVVLIVSVGVLIVGFLLAFAFIINNKKIEIPIYFVGGADVETGRVSHDLGYFKGYTGDIEGMNPEGAERFKRVFITNQRTKETTQLSFDDKIDIGRQRGDYMYSVEGDHAVSGIHCRLFLYHGQVFVKDLGSSNHTYLNGELVDEPVVCRSGDILKIGSTKLRIDF